MSKQTLYVLIHHDQSDGDSGDPCDIQVLGIAADKRILKREIDRLCEPYEQTLAANRRHDQAMKERMRTYLNANRDAIDGFEHRGFGLKRGDDLREEQDSVIQFLVNNWTYSMGGAEGFADENSFIAAYCDVTRLSRPFPDLAHFKAIPVTKGSIYTRQCLFIEKGSVFL